VIRRLLLCALALAAVAAAAGWAGLRWYAARSQELGFFEGAVADFEARDRASPPAPGAVVFVGSSSIRLWSTLARDLAPLPVLNRGFGGSQMSHVAHYARRIVTPLAPRAVVVYAGDNDLAEGTGKTAETVRDDFAALVAALREAQPGLPIFYLTIKPSRLRWARWPEMQRANRLVAELAARDPRLHVVDVGTPLLGPDATPRRDVFRLDGLHLNANGYAAWTAVLRPLLLREVGAFRSEPAPTGPRG
jgi:lysophospholipase L1-like esterase